MKTLIIRCIPLVIGILFTVNASAQFQNKLDSVKQLYKLKQYTKAEDYLSSFIDGIAPSDTANYIEGHYRQALIHYRKKNFKGSLRN